MAAENEPTKAHPDAPEEPDELGELTHDAIAGDFRIFQRLHGHRYSLDDVLTAHEAACAVPNARACLELGSGIGSVLLMLAYKLRAARFVAVEAQRNSFRLLARNIEANGLADRVTAIAGDLRDVVTPERLGRVFDLITGTPPYVPPGTATPSSDAQRAYARQEFRGGVEAYLAAAGRVLAPHGRVIVCADARSPERVFAGARTSGLVVIRQRDVVPRAAARPGTPSSTDKPPLFSVFTLASGLTAQVPFVHEPPWIARDALGARTEAYLSVRAFFGLPAPSHELPSP